MRPSVARITRRKARPRDGAKAHAPRGPGAQASSWLVSGVKAPGAIHESGGKLHQRATAGAVLRSSGDRGRARGSHRLQKSTGGARPLSPMCEERVDNEGWSSPGARERCGVKERRKPARPWQSGGYGGGLSTYSEMAGAKALSREHLSIEGVSGRTKSFVLTSGRWKRSWPLPGSDGSNPVGLVRREQSRRGISGNRDRQG